MNSILRFFRRKRKRDSDSLLQLEARPFVEAVEALLMAQEPSGRLMTFVALNKLYFPAMAIRDKLEEDKVPRDSELAEMATMEYWMRYLRPIFEAADLSEERVSDEYIRATRAFWTYLGACVLRAGEQGEKDEACQKALLSIWIALFESLKFKQGALKNNVLWTDEEKEWFLMLESVDSTVRYFRWMKYIPASVRTNQYFLDTLDRIETPP